jgi:hypothetical protein
VVHERPAAVDRAMRSPSSRPSACSQWAEQSIVPLDGADAKPRFSQRVGVERRARSERPRRPRATRPTIAPMTTRKRTPAFGDTTTTCASARPEEQVNRGRAWEGLRVDAPLGDRRNWGSHPAPARVSAHMTRMSTQVRLQPRCGGGKTARAGGPRRRRARDVRELRPISSVPTSRESTLGPFGRWESRGRSPGPPQPRGFCLFGPR